MLEWRLKAGKSKTQFQFLFLCSIFLLLFFKVAVVAVVFAVVLVVVVVVVVGGGVVVFAVFVVFGQWSRRGQ